MSKDLELDVALRALIAGLSFGDQSEVLTALAARGHVLTQSTLSRKLKQLGVQKQGGRYVLPGAERMPLISVVRVPPNLLVLKTDPGFANALAARLDAQPIPGQAGTLAGDDTIFLAIEPAQLELAYATLQRLARAKP
jgi:transcriptional regulator of arginine metabolism